MALQKRTQIVAAAVGVLLLAGCEANGPATDTDTTPQLADEPTSEPEPAPEPSPESEPEIVEADDIALAGTARCEDPIGDPTGEDGTSPRTIPPGQDLRAVTLEIESEVLTVVWQSNVAIPAETAEPTDLYWGVDLWVDHETGYGIGVFLNEDTWSTQLMDWSTTELMTLPTEPERLGDQLTQELPLELMPRLVVPFRWYAVTEWGDLEFFNDSCPGGGNAIVPEDEQLPFPSPDS